MGGFAELREILARVHDEVSETLQGVCFWLKLLWKLEKKKKEEKENLCINLFARLAFRPSLVESPASRHSHR